MLPNLTQYYKNRAKEYDKVYQIPEEQEDLALASAFFQKLFADKNVLEIACGTGYWSAQIAKTAISVLATDINESVIEIAKARYELENTVFEIADMYTLDTGRKFEALFGGFIWSHILLQDLDNFLYKTAALLHPGSPIAFIDSKMVANGAHDARRISRNDDEGNTYQTRVLEDGACYEVLKNFPSEVFLLEKLSAIATNIEYIDLEHYWIACGKRL